MPYLNSALSRMAVPRIGGEGRVPPRPSPKKFNARGTAYTAYAAYTGYTAHTACFEVHRKQGCVYHGTVGFSTPREVFSFCSVLWILDSGSFDFFFFF